MTDCFGLHVLILMVCDQGFRFPNTRSSKCNLVYRKVQGAGGRVG